MRPYQPGDVVAVREFNKRLRDAAVEFQFPETHISREFPALEGRDIFQEHFLASDQDGVVHGGYILKTEPFLCSGRVERVANYQLPLSEGIVDKRFTMIGVQLLMHALKSNRKLYCLGMGGVVRPLPQMLARFGWDVQSVPFFFRVINGSAFAREIRAVGESGKRLLSIASATGLAALGAWGWSGLSEIRALRIEKVSVEKVVDFPDEVGSAAFCEGIECLSQRSAQTLKLKFPRSDPRFHRLLFRDSNGSLVGWALLTYSVLKGHKQFGDMRLGALVDGLARPGFEASLVRQSLGYLAKLGTDLVVSNQTHERWTSALLLNGFLQGPSNFALARSPNLKELGPDISKTHFNRGDGDGPINL